MTNNLAERTVKPFVIDRKNFLFSATDKGADASALFMSVIETAKRNGLNVFGYLSYLMLVLPSWGKTPSEEQLDSIMPWSATLPETCHRTYHQRLCEKISVNSTTVIKNDIVGRLEKQPLNFFTVYNKYRNLSSFFNS